MLCSSYNGVSLNEDDRVVLHSPEGDTHRTHSTRKLIALGVVIGLIGLVIGIMIGTQL